MPPTEVGEMTQEQVESPPVPKRTKGNVMFYPLHPIFILSYGVGFSLLFCGSILNI